MQLPDPLYASAFTSKRRYQISANSISIAILPRVKGMNLLGLLGSGCSSFDAALTQRPLMMCADRSPCQTISTVFQPS